MLKRFRSHLPIVSTAVVTAAVFAAGPSLAQAAYDAVNSDKVDGKHAVGAGASPSIRAGKLVATNGSGLLPNNIIAKAANSDSLDGLDSTSFLGANAKAADSDSLDGLDSTSFLGANAKAADSDSLDGLDSTSFLGANAKAADSDKLDGLDSAQLQSFVSVHQGGNFVDECDAANEWRECAVVLVTVPANRTYHVIIDSAGSFASNVANRVKLCTSVRPSTTSFVGTGATVAGCPNIPTGIHLPANELRAASTNGFRVLPGGDSGTTYVISTAVRPDALFIPVSGYDHGVIHTLVTVMRAPSAPVGVSAQAPRLRR